METSFKEGMEYSRWFDITKEMVMQFAELTGDRNPVHLDEAYAKGTRFGKCIVPGMLIGGLISRIIGMDFPGNGSIYMGQELKFYSPVYVGGRIPGKVESNDFPSDPKYVFSYYWPSIRFPSGTHGNPHCGRC